MTSAPQAFGLTHHFFSDVEIPKVIITALGNHEARLAWAKGPSINMNHIYHFCTRVKSEKGIALT